MCHWNVYLKRPHAGIWGIYIEGDSTSQSYLYGWPQEIFQLEATPPENRVLWHKVCDIIAIGAQLQVQIGICLSHVGTSRTITAFGIHFFKKWLRVKCHLIISCSNTCHHASLSLWKFRTERKVEGGTEEQKNSLLPIDEGSTTIVTLPKIKNKKEHNKVVWDWVSHTALLPAASVLCHTSPSPQSSAVLKWCGFLLLTSASFARS